jgi:hypothetical protein
MELLMAVVTMIVESPPRDPAPAAIHWDVTDTLSFDSVYGPVGADPSPASSPRALIP